MSEAFKVFDASKNDGKVWEITQDNSDYKKYTINWKAYIPTVVVQEENIGFLMSPEDVHFPLLAEFVQDTRPGFVSFMLHGGAEGSYRLAVMLAVDDLSDERVITVNITNNGLFQPNT